MVELHTGTFWFFIIMAYAHGFVAGLAFTVLYVAKRTKAGQTKQTGRA